MNVVLVSPTAPPLSPSLSTSHPSPKRIVLSIEGEDQPSPWLRKRRS